MTLVAALVLCAGAPTAWAQDGDEGSEESEAAAEPSDDAEGGDVEGDDAEGDADEDGDAEGDADEDGEAAAEGGEAAAEGGEKERKSKHGAYEFKRSFGGGVEFGLFFTPFERWNGILLEPNEEATFDTDVALNLDLAFEFMPFEGGRFGLFGGIQGPGTDNPGIRALYFGLEPAFAFRRERWELALGSGFGLGRVDLSLDSGASARSGVVLMRPFLEARTYATDFAAAYARVGFNYWLIYDEELTGLERTQDRPGTAGDDATNNLNEGGLYLAVGLRFGSYPEPVSVVPDSDEDGLRDDVDDCPDEPEDKDEFEDMDGCPEPDNDEDQVLDEKDQCPVDAEDIDQFEDEDGCADPDNDGDGILDADDQCPDEAGIPEKQGCPIRDKDKDGVVDEKDQCPAEPEDKDGYKDDDGCPEADNDGDGLLDADDQCPNEPELMNGFEDEDGCPEADQDKDGIIDSKDKCPTEAETYNGNKDDDGCPDGKQTVVITETEIKILQKVYFSSGKAAIQRRSYKLLNTVANVLAQNPQITKIRVEGHTDDVGKDEDNLKLSKERAAAVKDYLVDKGVDAGRLESEGYGETKPVCENIDELIDAKKKGEIDDCRADNRRVQFKVLELNGQAIDASESVTIKEEKVIEEPIEDKKEQ